MECSVTPNTIVQGHCLLKVTFLCQQNKVYGAQFNCYSL